MYVCGWVGYVWRACVRGEGVFISCIQMFLIPTPKITLASLFSSRFYYMRIYYAYSKIAVINTNKRGKNPPSIFHTQIFAHHYPKYSISSKVSVIKAFYNVSSTSYSEYESYSSTASCSLHCPHNVAASGLLYEITFT